MTTVQKPRNLASVGCLAKAGWPSENLAHHVRLLAASLRLPERVRGAVSVPADDGLTHAAPVKDFDTRDADLLRNDSRA